MRLIDIFTHEMKEFIGGNIPPYAILSHTWEGEETTYKIFLKTVRHMNTAQHEATPKDGQATPRGVQKILDFCQWLRQPMATVLGSHSPQLAIRWAWVDTCCIDKRSTAELSEAINSMFEWYNRASICVTYLADVVGCDAEALSSARWFTRGWTLQELLAPTTLVFLDADWQCIGHRCCKDPCGGPEDISHKNACLCGRAPRIARASLNTQIATITGIDKEHISRCDIRPYLYYISIAEKMSWAAARQTTRVEDMSYCLLGLFDVHIPLLYGEGHHAFTRLQDELLRITTDDSIFMGQNSLLARSALDFSQSKAYVVHLSGGGIEEKQYHMRQGVFHIRAHLYRVTSQAKGHSKHIYAMPLNCAEQGPWVSNSLTFSRSAWKRSELVLWSRWYGPSDDKDLHTNTGDLGPIMWKISEQDKLAVADAPRVHIGLHSIRIYADPYAAKMEDFPVHQSRQAMSWWLSRVQKVDCSA